MNVPMYSLTQPDCLPETLSLEELRVRLPELHPSFTPDRLALFLLILQRQGFADDHQTNCSAVWSEDTKPNNSLLEPLI